VFQVVEGGFFFYCEDVAVSVEEIIIIRIDGFVLFDELF
jgi:hypothetical protein